MNIRLPLEWFSWLRWLAPGGVIVLLYVSLGFLLEPRLDEAARINDFICLLYFEFSLLTLSWVMARAVHHRRTGYRPGTFIRKLASVLALIWAIGAVLLLGLCYKMLVEPRALVLIVVSMVLTHFILGYRSTAAEARKLARSSLVKLVWFLAVTRLLYLYFMHSKNLPVMGLTPEWLDLSGYAKGHPDGRYLDDPHVYVWAAVIYYAGILAAQVAMTAWNFFRKFARPASAPLAEEAGAEEGQFPDGVRHR